MNLVKKYENYRAVLKSSFLIAGEKQGHSLPADARNSVYMHFGDSTLFLGWYIGILATEYYLLSREFIKAETLNVRETLQELFFAVNALKRLIGTAAECFKTVCQGPFDKVPGFFIRDDVTSDIKEYFSGVEKVSSDFIAEDPYLKEESQDQLIHLLLGFSLVRRFIPGDTCVQEENILEMSQKLAFDICSCPSKTGWVIKNPYCGYKKVNRGPYAYFFSFPIVTSLQYIVQKGKELLNTVKRIFRYVWKNFMKYHIPCVYNATNLHLVLTLACMSDSWGKNSIKYLVNLSKKFNWPVYPMINIVLYSDNISHKKQYLDDLKKRAKSMLENAPEEGLSHEGSPKGWKSSHRFLFETRAQDEGQEYYKGMSFSGVDFMLLHNIYQIINRP